MMLSIVMTSFYFIHSLRPLSFLGLQVSGNGILLPRIINGLKFFNLLKNLAKYRKYTIISLLSRFFSIFGPLIDKILSASSADFFINFYNKNVMEYLVFLNFFNQFAHQTIDLTRWNHWFDLIETFVSVLVVPILFAIFQFFATFFLPFFFFEKKGPDEGWRTVWRFQNCPIFSKKSKKCQKWGSRILHQNLRFWYTTVFCQKVEKKRSK